MVINVQKALGRWLRKAFHRIVYVERKKHVPMYTPQLHVLNLLEDEAEMRERQDINFDRKLDNFFNDLDAMVEEKGEEEALIPETENELIKFVRRAPSKNASYLRIKYGKGW